MRITFDRSHLEQLLELSAKTASPQLTMEQRADPANWRSDLPAERRAALDADAEKWGGFSFEARQEDVDLTKIERGLILVGDQGVYFMSQASNEEVKAAGVNHVAYAHEINPETLDFDTWYDMKRAAFGGDDGTIFISEETLRPVLDAGGDTVDMDLTPHSYGFYLPTAAPKR
jgi:hypothetical protein